MEKNWTKGGVFKSIVFFSLPYLLSYFLQTLYGVADLFIIGQFTGSDMITAVSNGSQIMHMVTVIIVGLAMGATVTIGKAVGGDDLKGASSYIGNSVTLFLGLSVAATAVLLISVRGIVLLLSTPAEACEATVLYLIICFAGIPAVTAYNVISSIFRGLGDSKSPMYFIAIACLVNVVLDYILVGLLGMGAAGAALATTIAQTVSVIISLIFITGKKTGISLAKSDFKPDKNVMGQIMKIGVPVACQDGFIQISFIVITIIANMRGLDTAAAVGIVEKIIGAAFIVPSSMLASVSALASQNIGAGRKDRADKTLFYAILISIVYGIIVAGIVELMPETVVSIFTKEAPVIMLGGQYICGYITDCLFAGIHFCFTGYFCASGKSYIGFIHNLCSILIVRVPGSYLASVFFPETLLPMGFAAPAGSVLSIIICVAAFLILHRKNVKM